MAKSTQHIEALEAQIAGLVAEMDTLSPGPELFNAEQHRARLVDELWIARGDGPAPF